MHRCIIIFGRCSGWLKNFLHFNDIAWFLIAVFCLCRFCHIYIYNGYFAWWHLNNTFRRQPYLKELVDLAAIYLIWWSLFLFLPSPQDKNNFFYHILSLSLIYDYSRLIFDFNTYCKYMCYGILYAIFPILIVYYNNINIIICIYYNIIMIYNIMFRIVIWLERC